MNAQDIQDIQEFQAYLEACTDRQVIGVFAKECKARRTVYIELARAEARKRGIESELTSAQEDNDEDDS